MRGLANPTTAESSNTAAGASTNSGAALDITPLGYMMKLRGRRAGLPLKEETGMDQPRYSVGTRFYSRLFPTTQLHIAGVIKEGGQWRYLVRRKTQNWNAPFEIDLERDMLPGDPCDAPAGTMIVVPSCAPNCSHIAYRGICFALVYSPDTDTCTARIAGRYRCDGAAVLSDDEPCAADVLRFIEHQGRRIHRRYYAVPDPVRSYVRPAPYIERLEEMEAA